MFQNRQEAGKKLADKLMASKNLPDCVVVGLARGGVVVAKEVALALHLPLEVLAPRKIGAPLNNEFAIGAIQGNEVLLNPHSIAMVGATQEEIQAIIQKETQEMHRREALYRQGKEPLHFQGKNILLIDDGIATGMTLRVCIQFLKKAKCKSIVIGAPVAVPDTVAQLQREVDQIVCVSTPADFFAISQFYEQFEQVGDEEVCRLLQSP